ncbi:MAG: hypothetical protein KDE27_20655 [Planctomycetes bacterium]|nr:hypothetical protein [Planctomycetota bacterium]
MRAGLLSDPHVVALLRELFVPVHISALNTPDCMRDPRDAELLRNAIADDTDDFDGGEREAFVLPDGTMTRVFLSLHGREVGEHRSVAEHFTAEGRRAEAVVRTFRERGAMALTSVHGELPARWRQLWDDDDPTVAAIARMQPRWPVPPVGEAAFRVFARNSYKMYDDLHGVELAGVTAAEQREWLAPLAEGRRAVLPASAFVTLARAMVPRGQVDTELGVDAIAGELALVPERSANGRIEGRVEGRFDLAPKSLAEVGKRESAACLFESRGRLVGEFALDIATATLRLRVVARDVDFEWHSRGGWIDEWFEPWHRVAIEWVATDS